MILPKKAVDAVIVSQQELMHDVFSLEVKVPDLTKLASPGQFVQLRILTGAFVLRRPVGIAAVDINKGTMTFIYRVVGKGTKTLADLNTGDIINVLGPLGHGFDIKAKRPLIVGGGMGLSPVLFYAASLQGQADVLMGGKNKAELFWRELYAEKVQNIYCTTDDGSYGTKGFATTLLPKLLQENAYDLVVVCGPEIMMRSVAKIAREHNIRCQVSLEKRMGCGLGACLSCSIDTTAGERKKVCQDGPVFEAGEVFE